MRALIIKMSSLGDVIHTLPAITDAVAAIPNIKFDWLVEEAFQEIPKLHPAVEQVIPIALRRWRKHKIKSLRDGEWRNTWHALRARTYDYVIDAQGLLKSAFLARITRGARYGFDYDSAREPLASRCYQHKINIARAQHAVVRLRQLFAKSLNYAMPQTVADYGIVEQVAVPVTTTPYFVLLHGTTWATKHWPETYWFALAKLIHQHGFSIKIPWGNDSEKVRAEKIVEHVGAGEVLPKMTLTQLCAVLKSATATVAVDTGLGHLSAALSVPTISLYGPTNPALTGTMGQHQHHLAMKFACAPCLQKNCDYQRERVIDPPCFSMQPPAAVWQFIQEQLLRYTSTVA